jgi:hypothetical protein
MLRALLHRPPRVTGIIAVLVGLAITGASPVAAAVVFSRPGAMSVTDLPTQVRAGGTLTLREVTPLAIWNGVVLLERQTPAGWETLTSAPVRPRVFWLHWTVPADWAGSQISVRFVLESSSQTLAVSSTYLLDVATATAAAPRS